MKFQTSVLKEEFSKTDLDLNYCLNSRFYVTVKKRDQIRGQIEESKFETKTEPISFDSPHFVECYIIKDGVCVARDQVDVPIKLDSYSGYFIEQKKA